MCGWLGKLVAYAGGYDWVLVPKRLERSEGGENGRPEVAVDGG